MTLASKFAALTQAKDWKYLVLSASNSDDETIRKANPFLVNKFVKDTCGSALREIKSTNYGKHVLIVVNTREIADKLIKLTSIPTKSTPIPIKIEESVLIGSKQGIFFCRQINSMTDEEIIDEINADNPDIKVVAIRRIRKKDDSGSWNDTGSFVVQMRCETPPEKIKIGYLMQNLRVYIPDPMRCFRCNKLGHTGKRCRTKDETQRNCINCNNPHHTQPGEKCSMAPFCTNCDSTDHNSASRECPQYIYDKKINETMSVKGITRFEAAQLRPQRNPNNPSLSQRLQNANNNTTQRPLPTKSTPYPLARPRLVPTTQELINTTSDTTTTNDKDEPQSLQMEIDNAKNNTQYTISQQPTIITSPTHSEHTKSTPIKSPSKYVNRPTETGPKSSLSLD